MNYKTLLFSFTVVLWVVICVISAKELNENNPVISKPEIVDYITVDTAENKQFNFNGSELEVAQEEEECKCKNGKCMRKCDVEKTTPCVDKTMVCVCNPEFTETDPGVCEYCDCGPGISCTFKMRTIFGKKTCNCPKGYYQDYYSGKCEAECSFDQPCQNGGTCSFKRCKCPYQTTGYLCEEVLFCSDCVNRLEVDCLYNQRLQTNYCSCKNSSLYYDYDRDICIPCPCENGYCQSDITSYPKKLKCNCHSGYKEFNGYCRECSCGFGGICNFDKSGKKICTCEDGFFEREGHCLVCRCMQYSDMTTKCEVIDNVKRCLCKEGYKDVLGHCEEIDQCEANNTCHPSTTCHSIYGRIECRCPDGYIGKDGSTVEPGEVCEDINECTEKTDGCSFGRNVRCVNLLGSFKCACLPGYEPLFYNVEPHRTSCIESRKSWVPAVIVTIISVVLVMVLAFVHTRLKKRAARSN